MTSASTLENRLATRARPLCAAPALRSVALLALCSAYFQRPLTKAFDFGEAIAEMEHLRERRSHHP